MYLSTLKKKRKRKKEKKEEKKPMVYLTMAILSLFHPTKPCFFSNFVTLCIYLKKATSGVSLNIKTTTTTPWFISPWQYYVYFTRRNYVFPNLVTLYISHQGNIMCISQHHDKTTLWFNSPCQHHVYFTR